MARRFHHRELFIPDQAFAQSYVRGVIVPAAIARYNHERGIDEANKLRETAKAYIHDVVIPGALAKYKEQMSSADEDPPPRKSTNGQIIQKDSPSTADQYSTDPFAEATVCSGDAIDIKKNYDQVENDDDVLTHLTSTIDNPSDMDSTAIEQTLNKGDQQKGCSDDHRTDENFDWIFSSYRNEKKRPGTKNVAKRTQSLPTVSRYEANRVKAAKSVLSETTDLSSNVAPDYTAKGFGDESEKKLSVTSRLAHFFNPSAARRKRNYSKQNIRALESWHTLMVMPNF